MKLNELRRSTEPNTRDVHAGRSLEMHKYTVDQLFTSRFDIHILEGPFGMFGFVFYAIDSYHDSWIKHELYEITTTQQSALSRRLASQTHGAVDLS